MTPNRGRRPRLSLDQAHLVAVASLAANGAATVEEAAQPVVEAVCRSIGWPVGHLYLVRSGSLVASSVWCAADGDRYRVFRQVTQTTSPAFGEGLAGRALATGGPEWVDDVASDLGHPCHEAAAEAGLGAGLAVPVVSGHDVTAVLELYAPRPGPVEDSLVEALVMVCGQLARVVDRTRAEGVTEDVRLMIEAAHDAFVRLDGEGIVAEWSPRAEAMFGWSRSDAVGQRLSELIVPARYRAAHERGLQRFLAAGRSVSARRELSAAHRSGTEFPVELTAWATGDGGRRGVSGFVRDITERKSFEGQLARQALHDRLTGLPNRTLLRDRLELALARARRHGTVVALLLLDLDRFKVVNDSLGHHGGDQLLVSVAERLAAAVRPGDTVARMGGDEYAVLCEDVAGDDAVVLARAILAAFHPTFDARGTEVALTPSIGVVVAETAQDPDLLLRDADVAMYRAKQSGGGVYRLFDEAMRVEAAERLSMENDLRSALSENQFQVLYQPIVRVDSEVIAGFEALVRWDHPVRGRLSPLEFIPRAEETGLIIPLGRYVLAQACEQAVTWGRDRGGREPLRMSVNVSGKQLQQPEWADDVAQVLADTGLGPGQLVLEITESMLMEDTETISSRLEDVRRLGVRIAIDDFGTGYSSLGYLRRLPVDILKVDKSFIDGVAEGPQDSALARAVLKLATTLGLDAVAEGVATHQQLVQLKRLHCPYGQGFWWAKPQTAEAATEMLGRPSLARAADAGPET